MTLLRPVAMIKLKKATVSDVFQGRISYSHRLPPKSTSRTIPENRDSSTR